MLTIVISNRFLKDLRLAKKRGLDLSSLEEVVNKLANQEKLDEKYHDHPLSGDYSDFRECHIKPDWLLVYTDSSWFEFAMHTYYLYKATNA